MWYYNGTDCWEQRWINPAPPFPIILSPPPSPLPLFWLSASVSLSECDCMFKCCTSANICTNVHQSQDPARVVPLQKYKNAKVSHDGNVRDDVKRLAERTNWVGETDTLRRYFRSCVGVQASLRGWWLSQGPSAPWDGGEGQEVGEMSAHRAQEARMDRRLLLSCPCRTWCLRCEDKWLNSQMMMELKAKIILSYSAGKCFIFHY